MKISDRKPDVLLELGGRADLDTGNPSRLDRWYRDAYISMAMSYNFEQLENSYQGSISNTDTLTFPGTARALSFLVLYDSSDSPIVPDFKDIGTIRKMGDSNLTPGRPSVYTLFGTNIIFRSPFDDGPYTYILDTWDKPLISGTIANTTLQVPDDWLEALDYATMMRGHAQLGETDKALSLQRLLWGHVDPTTGAYVPGLLDKLQTRKQANAPARDYGLQPRSLRIRHV